MASNVSTVETTSDDAERDAVAGEQVEILHDADAGRHEQQRQRAEQRVGGLADVGFVDVARVAARRRHSASATASASRPITGPGAGSARLRARASPIS